MAFKFSNNKIDEIPVRNPPQQFGRNTASHTEPADPFGQHPTQVLTGWEKIRFRANLGQLTMDTQGR